MEAAEITSLRERETINCRPMYCRECDVVGDLMFTQEGASVIAYLKFQGIMEFVGRQLIGPIILPFFFQTDRPAETTCLFGC